MPHFIMEYSENIEKHIDFQEFFKKIHDFLGETGIFPLAGIRSRAIGIQHYRMADGKHDYAFIHMTLKVGCGRDVSILKIVADQLFDIIKAHFAELQSQRLLALSFEMTEFHSVLNYKRNNIHNFLKK